MNKRIISAALCILMAVTLLYLGVNGQFSDRYLIGYNFGDRIDGGNGSSGKDVMEVRICYDGTVDVFLKLQNSSDYDIAGSYKLTEDEVSRLTSEINQRRLLCLNPRTDGSISDGVYKTLYLYDNNDLVLKRCGGYMPHSEEFLEMYKAVQEVLHYEDQTEIYNGFKERVK